MVLLVKYAYYFLYELLEIFFNVFPISIPNSSALLISLDGKQRFYEKKSSEIENANELGKEVGEILKTKSNNTYKK